MMMMMMMIMMVVGMVIRMMMMIMTVMIMMMMTTTMMMIMMMTTAMMMIMMMMTMMTIACFFCSYLYLVMTIFGYEAESILSPFLNQSMSSGNRFPSVALHRMYAVWADSTNFLPSIVITGWDLKNRLRQKLVMAAKSVVRVGWECRHRGNVGVKSS